MSEHTAENIEKLASTVVESWDLNTLVEYAFTNLSNAYLKDETLFTTDFNYMFGEELDT